MAYRFRVRWVETCFSNGVTLRSLTYVLNRGGRGDHSPVDRLFPQRRSGVRRLGRRMLPCNSPYLMLEVSTVSVLEPGRLRGIGLPHGVMLARTGLQGLARRLGSLNVVGRTRTRDQVPRDIGRSLTSEYPPETRPPCSRRTLDRACLRRALGLCDTLSSCSSYSSIHAYGSSLLRM
jgi:hypothetical protein